MTVRVEKPETMSFWKPLVVVLVILAGFILWQRFAPRSHIPLAFEILSYEGDALVYDLQSGSWRTPKRGEELMPSQMLKTGKDGLINFQVDNEIHLRLKENSEVLNDGSAVAGKREVYKLRLAQGVLLGATLRQFEQKQQENKAVFKVMARDYEANVHNAIFRAQAASQPGQTEKVGVLRGSVEVSKPSPLFRSAGVRIRGLEEATLVEGVIQPAVRVNADAWGLMKESYELLERTAVKEAEQIDLSKMAGSFFGVVFDHGTFYTPQSGYAGREFFKDPESGQVFLETEYDVFPTGSFCGVYIKTRDFDLSKYAGLSFEVRRKADEAAPDSFSIEMKSKGNVVRRYAPRNFEKDWKPVEFDFHASKAVPVNEVVFVFTNARAGEAKKGVLEFRNIKLIPLPPQAPMPSQGGTRTAVAVSPGQPAFPRTEAPVVPANAPASEVDKGLSPPKEVPLQ